ncbi:MAG: hypothetical protein QOD01_1955, partial [Actinomycetota bacterium]|nr:hypothetical protein [Actinomycetota bacterium]
TSRHTARHPFFTSEAQLGCRRLLESLSARHLDELPRVGLSFGEISAGIDAGT